LRQGLRLVVAFPLSDHNTSHNTWYIMQSANYYLHSQKSQIMINTKVQRSFWLRYKLGFISNALTLGSFP